MQGDGNRQQRAVHQAYGRGSVPRTEGGRGEAAAGDMEGRDISDDAATCLHSLGMTPSSYGIPGYPPSCNRHAHTHAPTSLPFPPPVRWRGWTTWRLCAPASCSAGPRRPRWWRRPGRVRRRACWRGRGGEEGSGASGDTRTHAFPRHSTPWPYRPRTCAHARTHQPQCPQRSFPFVNS